MKASLNRWSRVFAMCLLGLLRVSAQSGDATVTGSVLDVTGKAIAGAAVSVRSESTGLARSASSDGEGRFSVAGLPAGDYSVEASAPSFATSRRTGVKIAAGGTEDVSLSLNVGELSQTVTVEGTVSMAAELAPSQSTLEARSAKSEISPEFIQNFASPVADFSELLQMAPGTFSVNPNGVGLGDSKTFFRGFKDGLYTMTVDGIPFNDSNDPTHHSWAFFPSQFIAGIDFDRSPGSAATVGPTNFGGRITLLSRSVPSQLDIRATGMYSSFNTRMLALDFDSGQFGGKSKKSSLVINLHQMLSDGYQTYNYQKRVAGFLKYQYQLNARTTFTVFGGLVDLWTNTPNAKGPTRAQVEQFGDNYLLSNDPSRPDYYGYNFYHVQTDFEYFGTKTYLGRGWQLDNKMYTYRYWNKQNYNGTTISKTSATDKLNGYRKVGDILAVSHESARGILRTGLWYEWAYTDRYQIPSDPRTWVNAALPNFHENFNTTSLQPFAEYEYKVTRDLSVSAGIKLASYKMDFMQFADNGKTVGSLNGAPFIKHDTTYRNWSPSVDARYKVKSNWTVYAQFATGSVIPPTSVFDTKNAAVAVLPKPTTTKTYQMGSVLKFDRFTLDFDGYYSHFQNPYSSTPDATGEPIFYQTGPSNTKGVEAESNILVGHGFSLYLNGTIGRARYAQTGLYVANSPQNTETVGFTYRVKGWDMGFFNKRIGPMFNDNGSTNQAVPIDPFNVSNLFLNYTIRGDSYLRGTKIRFGVNNLADKHNIVGVTPASTASSVAAPGDLLIMLPARSFSLTVTFGYAPAR